MKEKREFANLQRTLSGEDGFFVLERAAISAVRNKFLRSGRSKRIRRAVFEATGADLSKASPEKIAEKIRALNDERAFSEDELCSISDAVTLFVVDTLFASSEREKLLPDAVSLLGRCDLFDFSALRRELSAIEQIMREEDPCAYRESSEETQAAIRNYVRRYAKKHRIDEEDASKIVCRKSERIFAPKKTIGILYLLFAYLPAGAITLFCAIKYTYLCLFALFPVISACLYLSGAFFSRLSSRGNMPIPTLCLDGAVPDDACTLCVITTLLSPKSQNDDLFRRLERFYYQNRSDNICFALLLDLPDSRSLDSTSDREAINEAIKKMQALIDKHGEHFAIFIRRRTPSESEGCYCGWERKRGALIELARYLRGGEDFCTAMLLPGRFEGKFRYILTLDADTDLCMGAVSAFVSAMIHPCSKPVIKNGRVVSGYGVIAPYITPSLRSATASPFSVLISGAGGTDTYHGAHLDLYQAAFSHSVYCGKGIFDIDVFLSVIDGAFPRGRILSHDLLEGSRLRAGILSSPALTDSVPATPDAFFAREHRWIRGDTQAFAFAYPKVENEKGVRVKNCSDLLGRYILVDNLRRALTPIFAVLSLVFAYILLQNGAKKASGALIALSLSYILIPPLRSLFVSGRGINRRFYSKVLYSVWHSFSCALWLLVSLIHTAKNSLDAILRSVWRLHISRKKLLEWKTSSSSSPEVTLYSCWRRYFLSLSAGLLLILTSPRGIFTILGLLFFACPFSVYLLSQKYEKEKHKLKGREDIIRYTRAAWSYFERFVTEEDNFLPPDNYQSLPTDVVAHRTSPTNIGMYLLSCLAAADFEFITAEELKNRVEKTLNTLASLPKYRGQFYNWYDTISLSVIGTPYISSVDSGNLLASLFCLEKGLYEYSLPELAKKAREIAESMDFSFLFDRTRRLFAIGYDTVKEERSGNCYDLLMSEARTLSYMQIARAKVGREHWGKLSRPVAASCGHIGIASWSGTAFEYFMPALFLPTYDNSLMYESLGFALVEQQKDKRAHLFGRSESGYFAFDAEMNYQYRAFGAETLALDASVGKEEVIAPYASFLMLPFSPGEVLDNLRRMEEKGLYGEHGFFEACDFTPSRVGRGNAIIYSYMSHHVGMSIVASANYLFDGIFRERFMRDGELAACSELLEERVPTDAQVQRLDVRRDKKENKIASRVSAGKRSDGKRAESALISNGTAKLYLSGDGRFHFALSKVSLCPDFSFDPLRAPRLFISLDQKTYDILSDGFLFLPSCAYSFAKCGKSSVSSCFSVYADGAAFAISIKAAGDFSLVTPLFFFEPIMTSIRDYRANPFFCALTISCEYLESENALLFRRRAKNKGERDSFLCVSLECSGSFDFCVRRSEHLPYMYGEDDLFALADADFSNNTFSSSPLEPFCAIKKTSSAKGRYECSFLVCSSDTKSGALSLLSKIRREKASQKRCLARYFAATLDLSSARLGAGLIEESALIDYCSVILSCQKISRGHFCARRDTTYPIGALWHYGISGDHPILCLALDDAAEEHSNVRDIIRRFASAQTLLFRKGHPCDLVLIFAESDGYFKKREKALSELLPFGKVHSSRGGITLIGNVAAAEIFSSCANLFCRIGADTVFDNIKRLEGELTNDPPRAPETKSAARERKEETLLENARVEIKKGAHKRPRSYVYANRSFGTVITADSLGFTYFRNSQRFRLSEYSPDALLDLSGERLILSSGGRGHDLPALSERVVFGSGNAVYSGSTCGINYTIEVGCADKFPIKLVILTLENTTREAIDIDIEYRIKPSLAGYGCCENKVGDCRFYRSLFCEEDSDNSHFGAFLQVVGNAKTLAPNEKKSVVFLFGAINYKNDRCYYEMTERFSTIEAIKDEFSLCAEHNENKYRRFKLESTCPQIDSFFNYRSAWQADTVRQMARSAFYQSGGAWGFRDQLQDCVCTLPFERKWAKVTILRACAHQFYQGDVVHWFHEDYCGIRTRCSDDLVFLPFAVCEYIEKTADRSILDLTVCYLDAPALKSGESESYQRSEKTKRKESVLLHCMRALDLAISRTGEHSLCLIGSCDWNDGFSRLGVKGRGESVPLSFFLSFVLRSFAPIARDHGFKEEADRYTETADALEKSALSSFRDGYFIRAYDDNGMAIGIKESRFCKIDLLAQAASALSENGKDKAKKAMKNAFSALFNSEDHTFSLLSPPIEDKNYGYIASYIPGVRENGGQYTHAAIWAATALLRLGFKEEGIAVLASLSPAAYPTETYGGEPYMIAGDVYTCPSDRGRCGWSGYTGAAGWYFRAVLEELVGLKIEGDRFTLCPSLCASFPAFTLDFSFGGSKYKLKAALGKADTLLLDGEPCKNVFTPDGRSHLIEITQKADG